MDSTPIPSTPPGQKTPVFLGPHTPKSTSTHHRHRRLAKSLRTPKNTPFFDPAPRSRDALFEGGKFVPPPPDFASVKSPKTPKQLLSLSLFLPTPLTVGTGRKPRAEKPQFRKSPNSKLLLARLQAADEESGSKNGLKESAFAYETTGEGEMETEIETTPKAQFHASFASKTGAFELSPSEIDGMSLFSPPPLRKCSQELHEVVNTPRTPTQNLGIEQKPQFEPFFESDDELIRVMSFADLDKISRYEVPNPFRDCSLTTITTGSGRSEKIREKVDYSTHLELVNSRTGERKVEVLSEAQRRFKPKKLDFTLAVNSPKRPDYRIANKYLENSIGKNFSMNSTRPKGSLDFEIFKD